MKLATVTPADDTRPEISLPIDGQPRTVRFGLRFLKAYTTQAGGDGPGDALASLETAPIAALLDMLALAVRLSAPDLPGFTAEQVLDIIDELAPAEQEHIFATLIRSIKANPIIAALNSLTAAN